MNFELKQTTLFYLYIVLHQAVKIDNSLMVRLSEEWKVEESILRPKFASSQTELKTVHQQN